MDSIAKLQRALGLNLATVSREHIDLGLTMIDRLRFVRNISNNIEQKHLVSQTDTERVYRDAYVNAERTVLLDRVGDVRGPLNVELEAHRPLVAAPGYLGLTRQTAKQPVGIHYDTNTGATASYLNRWVGDHPPIALKIQHELTKASTEHEIDELMERVIHQYFITLQVPSSRLARFALDCSQEELQRLQRQYDTGIADPEACSRITRAFAFVNNAPSVAQFDEFEVLPSYIENVNSVVDEMEASLNNIRTVPKQNNIRWPFVLRSRLKHLTQKASMTFWSRKLHVMMVACNKHFDMEVDVSIAISEHGHEY